MKTITKKQIVHEIVRRRGMDPKNVQRVVQEFLDSVTENLSEGNRFEFRDFGVFEIVRQSSKNLHYYSCEECCKIHSRKKA